MRTTNIKTGNLTVTVKRQVIITEDTKLPCCFANVEKAEKRKEWKWNVGCKYFGDQKDEEYSFKFSKMGDVDDIDIWQRITSVDFAVELISLFRDGGEVAIKDWIKQGCP
jgi:hypothetical protein